MVHSSRCPQNTQRMPLRYGLSIMAVGIGVGIAGTSGHAVAWADPGGSGSSGQSSSQSSAGTGHGAKKPVTRRQATRPKRPSSLTKTDSQRTVDTAAPDITRSGDETPTTKPNSTTPQPESESKSESIAGIVREKLRAIKPDGPLRSDGTRPARSDFSARLTAKRRAAMIPSALSDAETSPARALIAQTPTPATTGAPPDLTAIVGTVPDITAKTIPLTTKVAAVSATTKTTPQPPEPLSPIAKIAELPGRIVNTVLQVLDITVSANGPKSPIDFSPISNALFAAFREIETQLGLTKTPAAQPVPPTMVYDGPTTGKTPTVSQFLNAATTAYVWGGAPGDLKPFVVNGKQMESTNILTGMSAKTWVTPDGQIIIAYQGTTGGTNLLHNPLIAVSQVVTDLQVVFTDTTPQAFIDAVAFQQQVEAAAIAQGYRKEDIFVTGHSLGAWEAQYVAQQTGVGGIGFEGPGLNSTVPGNGADSGFVNVLTYGDTAGYFSTDLPGLQPFVPEYVPGGGSKPHYGSIVMIGNPDAAIPLMNSAALLHTGPIGGLIFVVDVFVNFLQYHLPGVQAYHLGVTPDPGVVPWLGNASGPVNADYADMTIPELQKAASDAGTLIRP
ncbi:hypothetical protein H7J34_05320 [Mycolicibacterium alvei]|nr:hypothetical protein [Mycolicibacterium alvei]